MRKGFTDASLGGYRVRADAAISQWFNGVMEPLAHAMGTPRGDPSKRKKKMFRIAEIDHYGKLTGQSWMVPKQVVQEMGVANPEDLVIWCVRSGYRTEISQGSYAFVHLKQRELEGSSLWLMDCPMYGYTLVRSRAKNGSGLEIVGPHGQETKVRDQHRERIIGKVLAIWGKHKDGQDRQEL